MANTEHGETLTVRRVDERSWADLVTLTLENSELIMLTVEQYEDGKAAIAAATGVALEAVDMQGMTLTFGAGGISVPSFAALSAPLAGAGAPDAEQPAMDASD